MINRLMLSSLAAALAVVFSQGAGAQESPRNLIVQADGPESCEFLLKDLPSLEIDPQSGDVTAFVDSLESCSGGGAAAALFLDSSEVASESSFQVFWASNSESGCEASSSPAFPGWAGAKDSEGQQNLTAPSVSSDTAYDLSIDCEGAEAEKSLVVLEQPPEPVEITSFTLNGDDFLDGPSFIELGEGESLTVDWDTNNAVDCQAEGSLSGWNGSVGTSGPAGPFTVTEGATVGLACSNSGGEASTDPVSISVVSNVCASREQLPSDWVRKDTNSNTCVVSVGGGLDPSKDCRYFDEVWTDFPPTGNRRFLSTGPANNHGGKAYISMEFDSGNLPLDYRGRFNSESVTFGHNSESRIWTVSTCPGDFDKAAIEEDMGEGCFRYDQYGLLSFSVGSADTASSTRCALENNTTYYLNLLFTGSDGDNTPASELEPASGCTNNFCTIDVVPSFEPL